jgi:hypothetical protein
MRSAAIRGFSLGIITGSFFTAGAILLSGPAKADPDNVTVAYAATYGSVLCYILDEHPTDAAVLGIGNAIVDDGLTIDQAGWVIVMSVAEICPRHTALLQGFVKRHGAAAIA